jgi:SnoaL-like domain
MQGRVDPAVLADRLAIQQQIYNYCRAVDRLDVQLGYGVFHEDSVADFPTYQGSGRGRIDFICTEHLNFLQPPHQVANVLIDVQGDRAGSEAYVTATLQRTREGKTTQMMVWSRYIDQWSKRGGRWGIDKRVTVIDFDEVRKVTPMKPRTQGSRTRSDPSYAAVKGLR